MTSRVQIIVPENCADDYRFGKAVEYDQRVGRLVYNDSTLVKIDGELIQFPAAWIKRLDNGPLTQNDNVIGETD